LYGFANPPYLSLFLFSALPLVARYCVPGGVRMVSEVAGFASSASGFPFGSPAGVVIIDLEFDTRSGISGPNFCQSREDGYCEPQLGRRTGARGNLPSSAQIGVSPCRVAHPYAASFLSRLGCITSVDLCRLAPPPFSPPGGGRYHCSGG
jgi:hypothetical protein